MTRGKARLACGAVGLAWVLGVTAARADDCKPPKPGSWSDSHVEAAFDAGVSQLEAAQAAPTAPARVDKARLAEGQFRAVEARYPCLPPNVLHLAESLELQGRYLEAKDQYDRILASRVTLTKARFWNDSIAAAEKASQELIARIPEIMFHLESTDCGAASATMASTEQQSLLRRRVEFDAWFPVDPGEYSVTVTAGKCKDVRLVFSVEPGQRREIPVTPSKPEAETHPVPPPDKAKCLGMPMWVCFVGGGVLVASATAGTYLLLKPSEAAQPATACPTIATFGCTQLH